MLTPEMLQALYERHAFAVFRRCLHMLGDPDEARDAMQEVFLRVLEDPSLFQARSSPATFLFGVATHLCLNRIRRAAARDSLWRDTVSRMLEERQIVQVEPAEARQLAERILEEMDEETAAMAVYHFVDGLSQGEVAALVGKSRVTVNQKLRRFRSEARRRAEAS